MSLDNPRQQEAWDAPLGESTQFAPVLLLSAAICVIVRDRSRFLAYDLVPDFLYSSMAFCLNSAVYLGDGAPIVPPPSPLSVVIPWTGAVLWTFGIELMSALPLIFHGR